MSKYSSFKLLPNSASAILWYYFLDNSDLNLSVIIYFTESSFLATAKLSISNPQFKLELNGCSIDEDTFDLFPGQAFVVSQG